MTYMMQDRINQTMLKWMLIIAGAAVLAVMLSTVQVAHAQTPDIASLELEPGAMTCDGTTFSGHFAVIARDADGQTVPGAFDAERRYITSNGNWTMIGTQTSGEVISFLIDMPGDPLTTVSVQVALASDPGVVTGIYTMDCMDDVVVSTSFSDGRLNANAGDLDIVLYHGFDVDGLPLVAVYRVEDGRGILHDTYTYELFEPYVDAAPDANTWLASDGLTDLYALSTGEFQINLTAHDGKVYQVIFQLDPFKVMDSGEAR